jgi:hypothetical protein
MFDFLKRIFGSETGILAPFTRKVASKAVGGAGSLSEAFIKAGSGGALDALNFAKDQAIEGIHDLGNKVGGELKRIPVIGGTLAAEAEGIANVAKGALEAIPTTGGAIAATPEAQRAADIAKAEADRLAQDFRGMMRR